MKKKLSLLIASMMLVSMLAGCNNKNEDSSGAQNQDSASSQTSEDQGGNNNDDDAANTGSDEEMYTYSLYFNYDWWSIKPWAEDETSKYLKEKFNIDIDFSKPDTDPDAKLNIMISSGELPDAIMMERDQNMLNLARNGLLQPLDPLRENNSDYDDCILEETRELLKIDGELYTIPQWARKEAAGGNLAWMYNKKMHEAVGSPELNTFEDLYEFAKAVKENVPESTNGQSVLPFTTASSSDGSEIMHGFYRSFGGALPTESWYAAVDGELKVVFRDDVYYDSIMEANKWYREGLLPATIFSDAGEQTDEKIIAGRSALLYYDFSKDSWNHFRKLMMEDDPDNDYIIITDPIYPPANGLSADKIYADAQNSASGSGINITIKAEQPQRIFDLHSYLMTKEGAILQMYGPQGVLWEELDENGNPILLNADSEVSADESNRLGLWFWTIPGHADNVDTTKFAVNAMLPEDKQDWVITNQSEIFTPEMFVTNEYFGLRDSIDSKTDLGIQRTLCEDQIKAMVPRIIMADSEDEAESLYNELVKFLDENGMPEIEETYNEKYQENCSLQGGSRFNK